MTEDNPAEGTLREFTVTISINAPGEFSEGDVRDIIKPLIVNALACNTAIEHDISIIDHDGLGVHVQPYYDEEQ